MFKIFFIVVLFFFLIEKVYEEKKSEQYLEEIKSKIMLDKKKIEEEEAYYQYLQTLQFKEIYAKENLGKKLHPNEKRLIIKKRIGTEYIDDNFLDDVEDHSLLDPVDQWKHYFNFN